MIRLLEDIRDFYPKNFILSCPVMPFESGETALQNYNALMSLTWMQRLLSQHSPISILTTDEQILGSDLCILQ